MRAFSRLGLPPDSLYSRTYALDHFWHTAAVDEGGLLGDLPRSRPGTRSPKRDARTPPPRAPEPEPRAPEPGDLASEALRAAMGVAETGLKVASRVTAEVIRRVPRL